MNPKLGKLRLEREKNQKKIAVLTARNEELDNRITEIENLDIIGMVRENGLTPEMLAQLLNQQRLLPAAPEKEESYGI